MSQAEMEQAFRAYASLQALVASLSYKPGWSFKLITGYTVGSNNVVEPESLAHATTGSFAFAYGIYSPPPLLQITAPVLDSEPPHTAFDISHLFPAPLAYSELRAGSKFWREWLMRCIINVETHEAMEWFAIGGFKTFYPEHGEGAELYVLHDRTDEAA